MIGFAQLDKILAFAKHNPSAIALQDADKVTREAKVLVEKLRTDRCLQNYVRHIEAGGRNVRPEHAIGEKLWAELHCAAIASGDSPAKIMLDDDREAPSQYGLGLAATIKLAQLYLWSDEIEKVADAAPLPKHTISREVLPAPVMFWSRETAHSSNEGFETNWVAIVHLGEGFRVFSDVVKTGWSEQRDVKIMATDFRYGEVWPDDFGEFATLVGVLLKRFAFLFSPYVSDEKRGLPRHLRRQIEREGGKPPKDEVRVVALRRKQSPKPRTDGEPSSVEWQHQWWVGAHYRAQWYPSLNAHKVIWIAPYLKGPEDKPVIEKMYAVVR